MVRMRSATRPTCVWPRRVTTTFSRPLGVAVPAKPSRPRKDSKGSRPSRSDSDQRGDIEDLGHRIAHGEGTDDAFAGPGTDLRLSQFYLAGVDRFEHFDRIDSRGNGRRPVENQRPGGGFGSFGKAEQSTNA